MAVQYPSRPAIRYFGGKWKLAPWIIEHFPGHDSYIEPFGGGASVLIRKPRTIIEVYNDLNSRAVNFFRVLRERSDDLIRALWLTPYSREEYNKAHEIDLDPLEDARRWVILAGMGNRGTGTVDAGGWRWMKKMSRTATPAHEFYKLSHLYQIAERFQGVQIENDNALTVLQRYDTPRTLFYMDPPYLASTRCMRWQGDAYSCEMATEEEHAQLAAALHSVKGMVVLSGYPSELYNRLYADWIRIDHGVTMRIRAQQGRGKRVIECLWISPNAQRRQLALL